MPVPSTSDATFEHDVLRADIAVLVKFTADWCPPCHMVSPVLERISIDEAERLKIVSLDVDANPATALRYQVLGMPTLALFVRGKLVTQIVGAKPRTAILRALEPHLTPVRWVESEGPELRHA